MLRSSQQYFFQIYICVQWWIWNINIRILLQNKFQPIFLIPFHLKLNMKKWHWKSWEKNKILLLHLHTYIRNRTPSSNLCLHFTLCMSQIFLTNNDCCVQKEYGKTAPKKVSIQEKCFAQGIWMRFLDNS